MRKNDTSTDRQSSIDEAVEKLQALSEALRNVEGKKIARINVFEAAGLTRQEVKHSAFLAWLLNPKMPHGQGNRFLRKFCNRLVTYVTRDDEANPNSDILGGSLKRLDLLLADPNLAVTTERVVVDKESRTDILIDSPAAQTVIVIENKVFTGAHDDQLNRYERELERHDVYKGYEKVYVFLTPHGDSPTDEDGEYDPDWCVFDYGAVLDIVKEMYRELPRDKQNARLKIILEDYMDLVETNILLENKELRSLCKQIMHDHRDALDILLSYTDNSEEVVAYGKRWLQEHYPDLILLGSGKLTFNYYTQTIKDYFARKGEDLCAADGTVKCMRGFGLWDETINGKWQLTKTRSETWSNACKAIMQAVAPGKKQGERYFRFDQLILLDENERQQPFEIVRPKLEQNLQILLDKIKQFDNLLKTL